MAKNTKKTGDLGEDIACRFLERNGFRVIARNYRKPWGEIDIIAEKRGVVRFVEVKTLTVGELPDVSRETNDYRPEEQIHPQKLQKIARTAESYMVEMQDDREYQIDAVGVFLDISHKKARCRLFEGVL